MATGQLDSVIRHLRLAALLHDDPTDGQLLECFIDRRDEAAFEALLLRHGPMVWGVCRRVLRNEADAEDAFQATFLVLVRKASSITDRSAVGNWLYGVAHNTALKAKAMNRRRWAKEMQLAELRRSESSEDVWQHLQGLLDNELSQLPDKYRVPIVLCDLEGWSVKEASRQLGCPQGTVASRLARGRAMLAKRLTRHRLTLSGGVLASVLSQNTVLAGVPTTVVSPTVKAASLFAAGHAATTSVLSVKVAALTEGVLKTMLMTKLKLVTAVLLVVGILSAGVGAGGLVWRAQAGEDANPQSELVMVDLPFTITTPPEGQKVVMAQEEAAKKVQPEKAVFVPTKEIGEACRGFGEFMRKQEATKRMTDPTPPKEYQKPYRRFLEQLWKWPR